ncbi:MAG: hypothetical protein ABIH76_06670, partial [Candidatus Bathyarchaeota archaeon]
QKGGKQAFKVRLVLAATLSSVYGICNGYELCENRAKPGTEEYLYSEKYQHKVWDWDRPGNIKSFITRINKIRRENEALQSSQNLKLLIADNEDILFYGKWTKDKSNIILVVVNLNPFEPRNSFVHVPINEFGINSGENYEVQDLITGAIYKWRGEKSYVHLDPHREPAHVLVVTGNH